MDDAGAGRHDAQAVEGALCPAQQLVALAVALVLALDVEREGIGRAVAIDLDRMVDDQVGRHERLDERRVAAQLRHRVAQRREIDDSGHAGEVLEQDARRQEGDLGLDRRARPPAREGTRLLLADGPAPGMAKHVLHQDLDRHRRAGRVRQAAALEPVVRQAALADAQRRTRFEGIRN